MSIRIAVLGGSAVVTPQLVEALGRQPALAERRLEVVLIGRNAAKLERVASAARRLSIGEKLSVRAETDPEAGLRGASYVVNQVRAGGLEARAFDERFPQDLGLPGEETMGAGGFANAWRTLPVVADLFARCAAVSPDARLLNLTNPAGMVHQVAARAGLVVTTFCDSPVTLSRAAARAAGLEPEAATPNYVGTNHGGWVTSVRDDRGTDFLQTALADSSLVEGLGFDPGFVARIGALPNAYLRYVYHPDRMLQQQAAKPRVRAEELLDLERDTLTAYEAGDDLSEVSSKRQALWYTLCIAPAVASFISGEETAMIAGITNERLLSWLPAQTMLEVPVTLGTGGARTVTAPDALAPDVAALLAANAAYEALAVEALLHGDRTDRVRALAANPMIASVDLADRAVRAIEAREPYPVT